MPEFTGQPDQENVAYGAPSEAGEGGRRAVEEHAGALRKLPDPARHTKQQIEATRRIMGPTSAHVLWLENELRSVRARLAAAEEFIKRQEMDYRYREFITATEGDTHA